MNELQNLLMWLAGHWWVPIELILCAIAITYVVAETCGYITYLKSYKDEHKDNEN